MLLAFTVNSFVYFGFVNSYSSEIFNLQNFQGQFQSGIYQYRVLSGYVLLWIYDFLTYLNLDDGLFKIKFLNPDSEPKMYLSFYILNTVFLMFTAAMLVFITETKNIIATHSEKLLMIVVALFSIALTQFVIVPYDVSSYFLLLLFLFVFLKYIEKESNQLLILLCVIMVISSFNRETAALSLSLAATMLFTKFGISKKSLFPMIPLVVSFLGVYMGLRLMNETFTTNDGNLFLQNFANPKNILGILFWLVFFALATLLAKSAAARKMILYFHLFALPYILMSLYSGIMYEIRLYIPLFLAALVLGSLKLDYQLKILK